MVRKCLILSSLLRVTPYTQGHMVLSYKAYISYITASLKLDVPCISLTIMTLGFLSLSNLNNGMSYNS